jgi:hypothetical protein
VATTEYISLQEGVSVSAHSAGAYPATLLVLVYVIKGVGVHPPPSPARANFTLITECTPEGSRCNSVYSVVATACREANYSRVIINIRDNRSSRDKRKHGCQQQLTARIRIPFYSISNVTVQEQEGDLISDLLWSHQIWKKRC